MDTCSHLDFRENQVITGGEKSKKKQQKNTRASYIFYKKYQKIPYVK